MFITEADTKYVSIGEKKEKAQKAHCFLFKDIILLAVPKSNHKYKVVECITLEGEISVEDVIAKKGTAT